MYRYTNTEDKNLKLDVTEVLLIVALHATVQLGGSVRFHWM
jgi:hypothetical protein